eukprot:gnl/Hemi2/10636_TR3661_c1_g41_i1.p1 gnl/Hemi2/10636_TR3661_c1_g41~~gnl/Hemi2/10636_TR3661_c1_g41_i1.p1  ORF type:complete len:363 (+),score=13.89 gnl/Hemi2/10636_TR3661_c1_g41_i1:338-1426(+)
MKAHQKQGLLNLNKEIMEQQGIEPPAWMFDPRVQVVSSQEIQSNPVHMTRVRELMQRYPGSTPDQFHIMRVPNELADSLPGQTMLTELDVPVPLSEQRFEEFCKLSYADSSKQHRSCTLCLEDFADADQLAVLSCGHYFHRGCVRPWFQTRPTCPNCRSDCRDPTAAAPVMESGAVRRLQNNEQPAGNDGGIRPGDLEAFFFPTGSVPAAAFIRALADRVLEAVPPLSTLPTPRQIPFVPPLHDDMQACPLCFEEYDVSGSRGRRDLACGHSYHRRCIEAFCVIRESCPACLTEITDDEQGESSEDERSESDNCCPFSAAMRSLSPGPDNLSDLEICDQCQIARDCSDDSEPGEEQGCAPKM